jgi:hypothetical protein
MRFGRQRLDLVTMSGRELQRIEVLSEVLARRRTEISAAAILGGMATIRDKMGPFALRGVQFSITGSELVNCATSPLIHRMAIFCIKRECGLTFTNHTEHPLIQEAGLSRK